MNKKGVVISALGEKSFSAQQVARMKDSMDVTFRSQLDLLSKDEFIDIAYPAQILAVTRRSIKDINREIIDSLPNLTGLAIYSTGYEWVDVEYLCARGIKLSYVPDYASITVAEHTLAIMLVMSRRIHLSFDKVRGIVPPTTSLRGWELKDKRLGIVGFGNIGRYVAKLSKGFDMKMFYNDPIQIEFPDIKYLPFEELLGTSDVIVLTCSKLREAKPVIGSKEMDLIKNGAYLINTARADLVDSQAVLDAIRNKKLSGYAVDDEVKTLKDSSIEPGRILQTGHTAWYSNEAIQRGTEEWVSNIISLALDTPQNIVKELYV